MEELEVIKLLLEQNRQLTQEIVELAREALKSQAPVVPINVPMTHERVFPLSVNEAEEDARAAHAAGLVNDEQLADLLREANFFSDAITVPTPS